MPDFWNDNVKAQGMLKEKTQLEKQLQSFEAAQRKLDDAQKAALGAEAAPMVLAEHASVIKRPVVEHPGGLLVGFKEAEWAAALA